jgi:hypothetical protein
MSSGDISAMGTVPGGNAPGIAAPKNLIIGMRSKYARTPPAHMTDAMYGPMM